MRDRRFIASHRGGPLTKENHIKLIKWAYKCCQPILNYYKDRYADDLNACLEIAKDWAEGKATTGDAMKASVRAHSIARTAEDKTSKAAARAIGHTAATAHMADHSLGALYYSLKAIDSAGLSKKDELKRQLEEADSELREFLISAIKVRFGEIKFFEDIL